MIGSTARTDEVTVVGTVYGDDGPTTAVRLRVPAAIRHVGAGAIELDVACPGLTLVRAELIWIVSTNKDWVHMRGEATAVESVRPLPFRADLHGTGGNVPDVGDTAGRDRFALRVYAAGDDPNRASPIIKIGGWMDAGSVRLSSAKPLDPDHLGRG